MKTWWHVIGTLCPCLIPMGMSILIRMIECGEKTEHRIQKAKIEH